MRPLNEVKLVVGLCLVTGSLQSLWADCISPPAGLTAWWRAEGNALDSIATHHGILQNGVTFTTGMVGQSFEFDGFDDLIGLGGSSPFRRMDTITYAFWAKLPSDGGGAVMGAGAAGGQGFGGVFLNRTDFYFTWSPSVPDSDAVLAALGVNLPADQWMHFAVTLNFPGQAGGLYINGQVVPSVVTNLFAQPIVSWVPNGEYNVGRNDFLGGRFVNVLQFFQGQLDEVDIYNRALAPNEIAALFAADSAGKCAEPILQIAALPGAVRLTWPTNTSGFLLETNSQLTFPTGWGVLTSNYSVIETNYVVTNAIGSATRLYRLHKP